MPEPEDSGAEEKRLSELYPQLRRLAAAKMARERPDHTLQPTALVHEAWIRLSAERSSSLDRSVSQVVAAASESMRRILIDRARLRARLKHGGDQRRVPIEAADSQPATVDEQVVLMIHEAVDRLEKVDPVRAKVVVWKFFGGLSNREIAEELGLTERTVERYWSHAKAWLYREIQSF